MEAVFTERVRELKREGRAVLLSSHILSEVEKVCDTVTIIRAGHAVESGTLAQLRHLTRSRVAARVRGDATGIPGLPGVHDATLDAIDGTTSAAFDVDDDVIGTVLSHLTGLDVTAMTVTPPSLEDLFLRHYGDGATGSSSAEVSVLR